MKALLRWWHRWCYGYEMVNAYLAAQMGEADVAASHEVAAYQAARRLDLLSIQR